MTASFKRIDYSLRPAKHAERKMLCDVFRRMAPFRKIEEYRYVGFGSVWFSDFVLFHRALGVKDMVSIESSLSAKDRIEENKPFRIPVDYRHSKDALPELDWGREQFIWLDYDDPLSVDMLQDVRVVARRACSGTLLAVSVQCSQAPQIAEAAQDSKTGAPGALDRFIGLFGAHRVPDDVAPDDLFGWRYAKLSRRVLTQEIEAEIAVRNSNGQSEFRFDPICEIEYEDGAKMSTLVGVFYAAADEEKMKKCSFSTLDFLPSPVAPFKIYVPKLTIREFKRLESQLPLLAGSQLFLGTIPEKEAKRFEAMYRYLPSFAVLEA